MAGTVSHTHEAEPARAVRLRRVHDALSSTEGPRVSGLRRLAREPLTHFVLLGALTFWLHHALSTSARQSRVLSLSASKQRELAALFELRQHHAPNEHERAQLVSRWFADEVLFREGLRLDLVHSDAALREQIIARMRGMLQASVPQELPAQAELERFYAEHRADYAVPATIDFREHLIRRGPEAHDTTRTLLRLLQQGTDVSALPLPVAPPTLYLQRTEAQLAELYGAELARKLFALPTGSWQELHSGRGVHVVRLDARAEASEPGFAAVRERVRVDYHTAATQRVLAAETARLQAQWQLQSEAAP